ncbi:hypothetical protein KIPB_013827, partial [Kipferlia bialata]
VIVAAYLSGQLTRDFAKEINVNWETARSVVKRYKSTGKGEPRLPGASGSGSVSKIDAKMLSRAAELRNDTKTGRKLNITTIVSILVKEGFPSVHPSTLGKKLRNAPSQPPSTVAACHVMFSCKMVAFDCDGVLWNGDTALP